MNVTVNATIGDETILFASKEDALIFIATYATFSQFKTYCVELQVENFHAGMYRHYKAQSNRLREIIEQTMTDKNRTVYQMLKDKTMS